MTCDLDIVAKSNPDPQKHLRAFTTETTSELDVLGLDGDTLGCI